MIDEEIFRIGHVQKRELVLGITKFLQEHVSIDDKIKQRSIKLRSYGFHAADAIHIACAEEAQATFITTDKQILQIAERNKHQVQCKVYHQQSGFWRIPNDNKDIIKDSAGRDTGFNQHSWAG